MNATFNVQLHSNEMYRTIILTHNFEILSNPE